MKTIIQILLAVWFLGSMVTWTYWNLSGSMHKKSYGYGFDAKGRHFVIMLVLIGTLGGIGTITVNGFYSVFDFIPNHWGRLDEEFGSARHAISLACGSILSMGILWLLDKASRR